MPDQFTHGHALLVGVGQSANPEWSLPASVRDVTAIRSILTDPNLCAYPDGQVRLLHDAEATRLAILGGLAWLAGRAAADPDATAVVHYAGHGWLNHATGCYYLVPHDVREDNVAASALPAEAFAEAIRRIKARRLLVFMDCCYAEAMATSRGDEAVSMPGDLAESALPQSVAASLKQGEGRAVFASSHDRQRSWTRPDQSLGIYTHHLLEALQGAGNRPGDKVVCISNLMNHLGRTVPESARRLANAEQVPFFDAATEDFPVAMLRGGRGLPVGGWHAVEDEAAGEIRRVVQIVLKDVAIARGTGAKSASGRSVVADQINAPVVTGDGSIGAGGDVVLAGGSSRVQIGGGIQAGEIHAQNVVSGVQVVGALPGVTLEDLRRQVAVLSEQLAAAVDAGVMLDPGDAEDARDALDVVGVELDRREPDGRRVVSKLSRVTKILTAAAEIPEAMAAAGTQLVKLAVVARALWEMASKLLGG